MVSKKIPIFAYPIKNIGVNTYRSSYIGMWIRKVWHMVWNVGWKLLFCASLKNTAWFGSCRWCRLWNSCASCSSGISLDSIKFVSHVHKSNNDISDDRFSSASKLTVRLTTDSNLIENCKQISTTVQQSAYS